MEKLSEEVKLFEEMVEFMERVLYISNKQEVKIDDRKALSVARDNVNGVQRELCDVISSSSLIDVSLIVRDYSSKVWKELNHICKKVSNLTIKAHIKDYVDSIQHEYDFCIDDDDGDYDVEEINPYLEKKKKLILDSEDYEQTLHFMDKLKVIAVQEQVSIKDLGILIHAYNMIVEVCFGLYKIIDSFESSSVWDIDVSLTINDSRRKVQNELNYICNNMKNHTIKEAISQHLFGYKAGHRPTKLLPRFLTDRKRVLSQSEMITTYNKSKLGSGDLEFWSDADPGFGYHDHSKRIKKQEDICAEIDAIFRDCHSEDVGKGIETQHASTTDDSSEDDSFGQWEPALVEIDDDRAYCIYDSSIDDSSSEDDYEMS